MTTTVIKFGPGQFGTDRARLDARPEDSRDGRRTLVVGRSPRTQAQLPAAPRGAHSAFTWTDQAASVPARSSTIRATTLVSAESTSTSSMTRLASDQSIGSCLSTPR
jgi:hypothetical protein